MLTKRTICIIILNKCVPPVSWFTLPDSVIGVVVVRWFVMLLWGRFDWLRLAHTEQKQMRNYCDDDAAEAGDI